jgi:molybdopterin-containing oxidoreductase family membrane subunit
VIAIAEIKHILKRTGTVFKDKMGHEEAETVEAFAEEYVHHDH